MYYKFSIDRSQFHKEFLPSSVEVSIQNKTDDIREILWVECVTWSFAHVTSYSQRNFLYFCVGTVTAGRKGK